MGEKTALDLVSNIENIWLFLVHLSVYHQQKRKNEVNAFFLKLSSSWNPIEDDIFA